MKTADLHRQEVSPEDRRIKRDLWGHDVHTSSNRCIALLNRYYIQVLSYGREKRIILEAANADRSCALASALAAAYLWAPRRSNKFSPQVVVYLSAAKTNLERASSYEKLLVGALLDWIAGHDEVALTSYFEVLDNYPRDLGSLKRAQTLCFQMGRSSDMLRIARQVKLGCLPGCLEPYSGTARQCGESIHVWNVIIWSDGGWPRQEAENSARIALLIESQDAWAQHAHQCNFKEALDFMSRQAESWNNCCTFIYSHNWWHMAVCQLELGGCDAIDKVLEIFDTRIWGTRPARKTYQTDIDGLGLLLRLDLRGHSIIIGERISQLANSIKESTAPPEEKLLLEVLSVWALSRADQLAEAKQKLTNIGCRTLAVEGHEKEVSQLVTQLATALYEYGRDNYEVVCKVMESPVNIGIFKVIGASNEQLEVLEEMWCVCNLQARHFQRVIEFVTQRTGDRPGVSFSWRMLEEAYSNLGQGAEAQLAATKATALEAASNED